MVVCVNIKGKNNPVRSGNVVHYVVIQVLCLKYLQNVVVVVLIAVTVVMVLCLSIFPNPQISMSVAATPPTTVVRRV